MFNDCFGTQNMSDETTRFGLSFAILIHAFDCLVCNRIKFINNSNFKLWVLSIRLENPFKFLCLYTINYFVERLRQATYVLECS